MMLLSLFTMACAFAGLAASAVCLEKIATIPDGWKLLHEAPEPWTPMRISIAMRQPHIHELPSKILSATFLAQEDVESLRQPAPEHVHQVTKWLSDNGITATQVDHDWVHVTATVSAVDKLLNTKLHRYRFGNGKDVLRATEYHIPDHLTSAIDFVHPVVNFMTPEHQVLFAPQLGAHQRRRHGRSVACSPYTTPDCINKLYGINYTTPDDQSPVRFGIAGFLDQWASYADMRQNFAQSRPDLVEAGYNFSVESINGGENRQDAGTAGAEANLDIQYGMAVGFPTNVIFYSTAGRGEKLDDDGKPVTGELNDNEPYLDLLQYLAKKPDNELPHVLSISYADDEFTMPQPYAIRVCNEIGLLAVRGVSVLGGSGDGGARGGRNATCHSRDGLNKDMTISTFPASCPWVTSVGAVNNGEEPPQGAEFSAGGFSNLFPRPDWQKKAVEEYIGELKGHLKGYYNPEMRATPDISVLGTQFDTVINGVDESVRGTSASTPVLAAMIALINDARLRQGKKALGWLNGRLYSDEVRSVLQDITNGRSLSCIFSGGQMPGGWPATKGYDAITGVGVPNNFQKFMDVLVNCA
ncbi:hypothetical protein E4U30_005473 [Claviceps sp. LM220 group G6]|nr:hypothetical protein E4U30_005473 [Claviceps sp. LM220 group G6]KAG6109439.1 hypothetical protein E4U14_003240 [Claviceps sp. LM454 group G7]